MMRRSKAELAGAALQNLNGLYTCIPHFLRRV